MKDTEPKVFYDHKTATFAPPFILVSTRSKYRAYDGMKKVVTASRNESKKDRKETCLLPTDIKDLPAYDDAGIRLG